MQKYKDRICEIRRQSAVVNCQVSSWASIRAGDCQVLMFRPLSFLFYIKDLFDDLLAHTS